MGGRATEPVENVLLDARRVAPYAPHVTGTFTPDNPTCMADAKRIEVLFVPSGEARKLPPKEGRSGDMFVVEGQVMEKGVGYRYDKLFVGGAEAAPFIAAERPSDTLPCFLLSYDVKGDGLKRQVKLVSVELAAPVVFKQV